MKLHGEMKPLYSEHEKAKKMAEYMEKKYEYDHLMEIENEKYVEKVTQRASILWSLIKNCLEGGIGTSDIINETMRIVNEDNIIDKPHCALRLLKERKIILNSSDIPELNRRYYVYMPIDMNPELFITTKKILLRTLHRLGCSVSDKESDFIMLLLSQIPRDKEYYSETYEELNLIARKNGVVEYL